MEKILKYTNYVDVEKKLKRYSNDYDVFIVDLNNIKIEVSILNELLNIFRLCKILKKEIIFLSDSDFDIDLKKYIRIFKTYEEYKELGIYGTFQTKIYMNNEKLRNLLKETLMKNSFLVKERYESNFFNKEHDSRIKDIYIIDFTNYKSEKEEEIKKIKNKNSDTMVVLVIDVKAREKALKMVEFVDAIIEKPVNITSFINTIKKLANATNLKYENIELNNRLKLMLDDIENEISLAKDIQQSFLPKNNISFNGYNISYLFKPSNGIGGDYCDVIFLENNKIAVIFADISGHGIPAALLSSMLRVFLREYVGKYQSTKELVECLNEKIIEVFPSGKFVSLFCMIIDTNKNTIMYTKASQEPGLIIENNKVIELETEGQVLGLFSKKEFSDLVLFEEKQIEFKDDSVILLYTDGITEAIKNDKLYGIENLKEQFLKDRHNIDKIEHSLKDYELDDDLTLLTVYKEYKNENR
ncbi:PP2C family protein-serine/threonine phosphatase [Oceanivirga miroungae]|uniref:Phosphoserine phosphatase RsbU n=1 Tax=Oceanivirga miroungae TaxID=1130046 RepID=A0A6I8MDV0_9FUSO|nr:PP2C family protein-serine/threonine phosphatase [Oceanivirga miroungae]VWL85613.1 Phosphoserine phosphatase RsbU [Oceanivirga miroungae]